MKTSTYAFIGAGLIGLIGVNLWYWLDLPAPPSTPPATSAALAAPAPEPQASVVASQGPLHPIETLAASSPAATSITVESALTDLFGRKSVLSLFQTDDFPRRVVATVDNLGQAHAPARLWPLNPTPGRFLVERQGVVEVISADNGLRYTPYVLLIETVDLHQVVALYTKLYPLFQQAYVDLGYPKRYFNDRLVEVIDQLLATPASDGPIRVRLPTINGPFQPERPWVLYEFEDAALQSLTAGQKILLRMGPVNERRMKGKLVELRRLLTATAPTR